MVEKIKELRVQIDGLAKLVKGLKPLEQFKLDVSSIPDSWDVEAFLELQKKHGFVSENVIERLPQQFREIEKSYDSLLMAKAWLGKVLGELGEETPYKNDGKRKNVEDIEDAADTSNLGERGKILYSCTNKVLVNNYMTQKEWDDKSHIEKVDWLRQEIKNIFEDIESVESKGLKSHIKKGAGIIEQISSNNKLFEFASLSKQYLSEARFWLGFELQRIKELENKK